MKKFFMISALLTMVSFAYADNYIKVNTKTEGAPVEVPQGGTGYIEVLYNFDQEDYFANYSFDIYLPGGVTLNTSKIVKGDCHSENHPKNYTINYKEDEGCYSLAIMSNPTTALTGSKGTLVKLAVDVTADLQLDTELDGAIKRVRFAGTNGSTTVFEDITFKLKVVENRITLDENVGVTSETPTGEQNVLVKRTINAGNWSTICLPFAMTSAQVATAFGEKVKIAEFTGCETENNEEDEAVSIKINFESKSDKSIEANHPYIILIDKSDNSITEFKVDGVTIDPSEELSVDMDEYRTGSGTKKDPYVYHYNSFVGTYNAETVLEDEDILFISGNKFYYSNGTTTMKAFRGYFEFYDVLADKNVSAAKIGYSVDDETTSIDGISGYQIVEGVYDLSGRKIQLEDNDLNKLQKGVYIIDGKKVTIK